MGFELRKVGSAMTRPWLRHGIPGEWPWIDRELEENKVLNESSGEVSGSTCYSPLTPGLKPIAPLRPAAEVIWKGHRGLRCLMGKWFEGSEE